MKNKMYTPLNLGIGSLSLFISIFAVLFSFYSTSKGVILGEILLGPNVPYGIVSLLLWGISIYLGYKYSDHKYAKTGMKLSVVFFGIFIFGIIVTLIFTII